MAPWTSRTYTLRMATYPRKRPRDMNALAFQLVQEATVQAHPPAPKPSDTHQAVVALSKLVASKGGNARAAALSATRRSAIARKTVLAPWRTKA